MTGLVEPVPRDLHRGLRAEVLALRQEHRGLRFPLSVRVGVAGAPGPAFVLSGSDRLDLADRVEVAAALLCAASRGSDVPPVARLVRPGELSWHDRDAEWLPALVSAYAEAEAALTFVVVTKRGWYDPRSDFTRQWRRLRPRRTPAA